jgi:hypothetical protein
LERALPYLLLAGTLLVIVGLGLIGGDLRRLNANPPITVSMSNIQSAGGLFNSWTDLEAREGYVHAFTSGDQGDTWLVDQSTESVGFSFVVHTDQRRRQLESSGGYIRFYDQPVSRLIYRYLSFSSRVSDPVGIPDLGVRLVNDDPHSQSRDKEVVTYEIPSLRSVGKPLLNQSWQRYELYLWQFVPVPPRAPVPNSVDRNLINKIVFFISSDMGDKFSKGTLWFRDIRLTSEMVTLK